MGCCVLEGRGIGKDRTPHSCCCDGRRTVSHRAHLHDGDSTPHRATFEECLQGVSRRPLCREDPHPIVRSESSLSADLTPCTPLDVPDEMFPAEGTPRVLLEQHRIAVTPATGSARSLHKSECVSQDYHLDCQVHAVFMRGTA